MEERRRSGPPRFPVRVLPLQFGGPQDFWDAQEREHRAHARNLKVWGVILAIVAILGLAVHPVFFAFGGLLTVGALFTGALWLTTRRRPIPDHRQPETVEIELDGDGPPTVGRVEIDLDDDPGRRR